MKGKGEETASNDRNKTIPPPTDAMLGDGIDRPSLKALAPGVGTNEYAELKGIIKQQGLLDKQPAYYTYKILLTVGMLALSLTYEGLAAFWPNQPGGTPMVDYINSVPKHVLSTTLEEPLEWQNSTLIKGNGAEEIAELKRQPGKDITILGSGALVRLLLREGLLDELRLMVHPIVLGRGKRLFEEGGAQKALELVDSKSFGTGVLYLSYQPTQS